MFPPSSLAASTNPHAILDVVVMLIDATGKRRLTVLGMQRIYGEHSGANLGSVILEVQAQHPESR